MLASHGQKHLLNTGFKQQSIDRREYHTCRVFILTRNVVIFKIAEFILTIFMLFSFGRLPFITILCFCIMNNNCGKGVRRISIM